MQTTTHDSQDGIARLAGKTALVTGASRGIGSDIAIALASAGATVICAARTLDSGDHPLPGSLRSTVEAIRRAGGEAHAISVNVAEEEECERLVVEARAVAGPVDVLVNNAAVGFFGSFIDSSPRKWLIAWQVMCLATYKLTHLVLPSMVERADGRIISLTSEAAIGPGRGPYCTTGPLAHETMYGSHKVSLERFTQGLAEEVYVHGVGVAAVAPSQLVATPGAIHNDMVVGDDDPRVEPASYVPTAVLELATLPLDRMTGRIVYSQQLLLELGLISAGQGYGVDPTRPVSGFSQR